MNWKQRLRGVDEHLDIDDTGDGLGDAVLSGLQTDRHTPRPEAGETAHGKSKPSEDQII